LPTNFGMSTANLNLEPKSKPNVSTPNLPECRLSIMR
jgi:hypothetical protein